MSAMPTVVGAPELTVLDHRPVPVMAGLVWAGRTTLLLGLALLVPGEALRIGERISAPPRQDRLPQ